MSTRKELQSEATRADLVAAARRLFADPGYAATSIEEVVRAAGMTRGALYHHFHDKRDLFRAVFEDVEQSVMSRISVLLQDGASDPWAALVRATNAYLDACLERDVQQIILIDGPSVLGWDTWREIEERYALGAIVALLQASRAQGQIAEQPLQPLAHLILASVNEAGLLIARSRDVRSARTEVGGSFARLLEGLRPAASSRSRQK
jgi:AcrR family transcriptional regulator